MQNSGKELQELYERFSPPQSHILRVDTGDGGDRFLFEVRRQIDIDEAEEIVNSVCDAVVDPITGAYHPERKDFYLRKAVLNAYTNICLPQDSKCWEMVYGTPVFAMITGSDKRPVIFNCHEYDDNRVIDTEQYEQILAAIEQKIAHALELRTAKELMKYIHVTVKRKRVR